MSVDDVEIEFVRVAPREMINELKYIVHIEKWYCIIKIIHKKNFTLKHISINGQFSSNIGSLS